MKKIVIIALWNPVVINIYKSHFPFLPLLWNQADGFDSFFLLSWKKNKKHSNPASCSTLFFTLKRGIQFLSNKVEEKINALYHDICIKNVRKNVKKQKEKTEINDQTILSASLGKAKGQCFMYKYDFCMAISTNKNN